MQRKYRLITGLFVVLLFGGVFAFIGVKNHLVKRYLASYTPPPLPVAIHHVQLQPWAQHIDAVGTLKAVRGVDLSPATAGHVRAIVATQGTLVDAGAVVIQLDDEVEQAELRSLTAQLGAAELELRRGNELVKNQLLSKMQGDRLESRYRDLLAQKERIEALIARRQIRAPFAGQLGILRADVGQYVKEGEPLVTLQALDQLYVDFHVPEQWAPLLRKGQPTHCAIDAFPGETFAGRIVSIDTKVQADTHNLMVRAVLDNSARRLLPGMFVRVDVTQENSTPVLTVPQEAISYSLHGNAVFLVEKAPDQNGGNVVKRQYVELGEQRDNQVVVAKGLRAGDVVVASGMMDLRTGTRVKIVSGQNGA
jgi:membrane fusion protein (multidrug efflux system)